MQPIQPEWLGQRPGPLPVTPGLADHVALQCRICRVANEFGCQPVWYGGDVFAFIQYLRADDTMLQKAADHLEAEGYRLTRAEPFVRWEDNRLEMRITRLAATEMAAA